MQCMDWLTSISSNDDKEKNDECKDNVGPPRSIKDEAGNVNHGRNDFEADFDVSHAQLLC
eukprot:scaffold530004_cov19-Prasinocladus_malaysianus.AAC.2